MPRTMITLATCAGLASALGACAALGLGVRQPPPATSMPAEDVSVNDTGIDPAAIDRSIDACDDFYLRACGGFIRSAHVDADTPVVDMTQQRFDANLDRHLHRLFEQDATNNPELDRLRTFYTACLASASTSVDRDADVATVRRWLARIDAAASPQDVQALIRDLGSIGVDAFFDYSGRPDRTQWTRYRGEIHNGRLWADPAVVARTFVLAGVPEQQALRDAGMVNSITTALLPLKGDRHDAARSEHPRTLSQLQALAPAIDWRAYFELVGASADDIVNVTSPDYLKAVDRQLVQRPIEALRAYLRWTFLFSLRGELPAPYNAAFGDVIPPLRVQVNDTPGRCRDATVRAMGVEFSRYMAAHRATGCTMHECGARPSTTLTLRWDVH